MAATKAPSIRLATSAMATRFELWLGGRPEPWLRAAGEEAIAEIHACEAAISPFLAGSTTSRLHREAAARPVRVDPLTFELLEICGRLHASTDGAFDPTVGPLLRALGLRGEPAGDAQDVARARDLVGFDHVRLDRAARTVRFARPGVRLDFGAIGKGRALDLAAEVLRDAGVGSALLHGGTSTAVAVGRPPDAQGFRIAVPVPGADRPFVVHLADAVLSVSRADARVAAGGASHVVDPRRGGASPATRPTLAAWTTRGPAVEADAWTTALLVDPDLPSPHGSAALVAFADGRVVRRGDGPRFRSPDPDAPPATTRPLTALP